MSTRRLVMPVDPSGSYPRALAPGLETLVSDQVLVPGEGWGGATDTPAAAGDSEADYYDKPCIGRFTTVPYQVVTGTINVGVVAQQISDTGIDGIEKVSFSVDDGAWLDVTAPTRNPETAPAADIAAIFAADPDDGVLIDSNGQPEYWVTVDASEWESPGLVEVRAIVYTLQGEQLVLSGMYLYVDPSAAARPTYHVSAAGSNSNSGLDEENALATAHQAIALCQAANGNVDNLRILFHAGSYPFVGGIVSTPTNNNAWVTWEAAPGVDRADVIFNVGGSGDRPPVKFMRIKNATLRTAPYQPSLSSRLWLDGVRFTTSGSLVEFHNSWVDILMTDCITNATGVGPSNGSLRRNCYFTDTPGDPLKDSKCNINILMDNIGPDDIGAAHPDLYQSLSPANNVIFVGVKATESIQNSQGWQYNNGINGVAAKRTAWGGIYQIGGDVTNLCLRQTSFTILSFLGTLNPDGLMFEDVLPASPTNGNVEYRSTS